MATREERREWRESVERALAEREAARRYELRQREVRAGAGTREDRPGPRENPRLLRRVTRLISG